MDFQTAFLNNPQLEPLLFQIISCLQSTNNNILTNTLKVLNHSIKWPLKIFKKNYKKMFQFLLKILERLSVTDIELVKNTFKLIQEIISFDQARSFL